MEDVDDDPEIGAMIKVKKALDALDAEKRGRVLRWAAEVYGVSAAPAKRVAGAAAEGAAEGAEYAEIGDLFAAAQPATDVDRVLVGAYWFQFIRNDSDVDSFRVNTELKQLGHGVKNITSAFDSLIERRPQLVIQTKKSGSARQARKKYKVTALGKTAVESMLRAPAGEA